jgi:hypothetical protein
MKFTRLLERFCAPAIAVCATLFVAHAQAEALTATGFVFNDINQDGVRQSNEDGIPSVCVSNGLDVVKTGPDGSYSLSVDDDAILFVVKPSGWKTYVDSNNIPRFYHIHKPEGSPDVKFGGVPPTGPLPESVDFALAPSEEDDKLTALFFGDTQPRDVKEVEYIAHDVVEELTEAEADFGVTLGDLVFDDLTVFGPLNEAVSKIGVPWYNVLGNHDINFDSPSDEHSDETFERVYGPATYAFQYGPVHFLVLDNVLWDGDGYHGEFGEKQLQFIENYLEHVPKNALTVFLMHIPLHSVNDREAFFDRIEDRPNTLSVAAHWHRQLHFFYGEEEGWDGAEPHHHWINATVCGSWWQGAKDERGIPHATMSDGAPNGYSWVHFDGNEYRIRFKAAARPADYQMNVYAPESVAWEEMEGVEVLANVFAGSERSTVDMRIDDGEWTPMEQTQRQDPAYAQMKQLESALLEQAEDDPKLKEVLSRLGRPLPGVSETNHIWVGRLPGGLEQGTHVLEVRATDMFGQTDVEQRLFRVE